MGEYLTSMGPAVANHLWQSTAFAVVAAGLALALKRNHARARYWVWMAASLKFLLPFALLATLGSHLARPRAVPAPAQQTMYFAVEDFSEPFVAAEAPVAMRPVSEARSFGWPRTAHGLATVAALVWGGGFVTILVAWGVRWRRVARMVRAGPAIRAGREVETVRRLERAAGVRRAIEVRVVLPGEADGPARPGMEPGVFGVWHAVLAWPAGISERLDDAHLEAIVAHEVWHVRRRDNLTAALHMLVEAAFWFHPLVWWLGGRLIAERERACDEEVLRLGGRAQAYAEGILKVCAFCVESPLECVAGVTGADLKQRVAEIMSGSVACKLTLARKLLLAVAALGAVAVPVLLGQAQAAQRLAYAMLKAAPVPLRTVAHAIVAEERTQLIGEADEQPRAQPTPAVADSAGLGFDVSTVKPADPNARSSTLNLGNDDIKSTNLPVLFLLQFAYELNGGSKEQIVGAPTWLSTTRFDIDAKMDEPTASAISKMTAEKRMATLRAMMQTLLADRFHLVVRHETQNLPVLALMVAKGGAKIVSSSAAPTPEGEWTGLHNPRAGQMEGRDVTLGVLASALSSKPEIDGRLVVDETGLGGKYNFTLAWAAENSRSSDSGNIAGPSLFTALKEQLGLQLEGKKAPVDCIVIDHVEKPTVDGAEVPGASLKPVAMVQEKPVAESSRAQSQSQNTAAPLPRYEYEAATIKPSQGPGPYKKIGMWAAPDGFSAWFITPQQIISIAYGVESLQLSGGPSWLPSERFDIEAKMDAATTEALAKLSQAQRVLAQQQMLQALLADRFQLTVHRETKEGTIYTLVIAKGGPKLQEAKPGDPGAGNTTSKSSGDLTAQAVSIARLAKILMQMLGRPVLDKTELKGVYDFKLQFTPDDRLQPPNGAAANARLPVPPADSNAPSLFEALQEQLGLKLESGKGPVEVIVVDHVERPSAN